MPTPVRITADERRQRCQREERDGPAPTEREVRLGGDNFMVRIESEDGEPEEEDYAEDNEEG